MLTVLGLETLRQQVRGAAAALLFLYPSPRKHPSRKPACERGWHSTREAAHQRRTARSRAKVRAYRVGWFCRRLPSTNEEGSRLGANVHRIHDHVVGRAGGCAVQGQEEGL